MTNTVLHYVGGRSWEGKAGRFGDVYNPATGERTRQVAMGGPSEVDPAVRAAAAAFPEWSATPPLIRARVMFKFRELLEREAESIASMAEWHARRRHAGPAGQHAGERPRPAGP